MNFFFSLQKILNNGLFTHNCKFSFGNVFSLEGDFLWNNLSYVFAKSISSSKIQSKSMVRKLDICFRWIYRYVFRYCWRAGTYAQLKFNHRPNGIVQVNGLNRIPNLRLFDFGKVWQNKIGFDIVWYLVNIILKKT